MSDNWCLIESDPGVFTELIRGFGATGLQVEELFTLDTGAIEKPVHGMIFLFKWMKKDFSDGTPITDLNVLDQIYFARQMINNACATQAIINIVMNCNHSDLTLGKTLEEFKTFTLAFDSDLKGEALSNTTDIRTVHNSFSRDQIFEFEDQHSNKKDDDKEAVYHFISFVPVAGRVVELDGLKTCPVDLGPVPTDQCWTTVVTEHLQKRIQKYGEGEIHFNLMAVVSDRKMLYKRRLNDMGTAGENSMEAMRLQQLIQEEESKATRFKVENIRRRHNFLPMIIEVLSSLAKEDKLDEAYATAKNRAITKKMKKSIKD